MCEPAYQHSCGMHGHQKLMAALVVRDSPGTAAGLVLAVLLGAGFAAVKPSGDSVGLPD